MKNCPYCNAINNDESSFCEVCGADMNKRPASGQNAQPAPYPNVRYAPPQPSYYPPYGYQPVNESMLPLEYQPVSVGQYIGYTLLFSIPLIGFIMMFVIAFGSGNSKSLRNFAKSYLIMTAVGIGLMVFFSVLMAALVYSVS